MESLIESLLSRADGEFNGEFVILSAAKDRASASLTAAYETRDSDSARAAIRKALSSSVSPAPTATN